MQETVPAGGLGRFEGDGLLKKGDLLPVRFLEGVGRHDFCSAGRKT